MPPIPASGLNSDKLIKHDAYLQAKAASEGHPDLFSMAFTNINGSDSDPGFTAYFFNNETEFNDFISNYAYTDPQQLADIAESNAQNGVVIDYKLFTVNENTSIEVPRFFG
jgi:hypothetical protein